MEYFTGSGNWCFTSCCEFENRSNPKYYGKVLEKSSFETFFFGKGEFFIEVMVKKVEKFQFEIT